MTMISAINVKADEYPKVGFPYWHCSVENTENIPFQFMSDCNASHYEHSEAHERVMRGIIGELFNHELTDLTPADISIENIRFSAGMQSPRRYMTPRNEGYLAFSVRLNDHKALFHVSRKFDFKCFYTGPGAGTAEGNMELLRRLFKERFHAELEEVVIGA